MLSEIRRYVEKNNSGIMPEYNELLNISNDLFNTLAINYATNISSRTLLDKEKIVTFIKSKLTEPREKAKKYGENLKKRTFIWQSKRDARDVLVRLAVTLEVSLDKVFSDLKKL